MGCQTQPVQGPGTAEQSQGTFVEPLDGTDVRQGAVAKLPSLQSQPPHLTGELEQIVVPTEDEPDEDRCWHRDQIDGDAGDQSQRPLGADEQIDQVERVGGVVAGGDLLQLGQPPARDR